MCSSLFCFTTFHDPLANSLHAQGCCRQAETAATCRLPPWWHHQRQIHLPLPSRIFLRGGDCSSNKLQAVPAWPYLCMTWHKPSPLLARGTQSIYFLGKNQALAVSFFPATFHIALHFTVTFREGLRRKGHSAFGRPALCAWL